MREPKVSSVMTTDVITVTPETSFKQVVATLSANGIGAVPVVGRRGEPVGVVSEADVLAKQEFHGGADTSPRWSPRRRLRWFRARGRSAAEVMSAPVVTIGPDEPVALAARRMAAKQVRRLFVVGTDGTLVGVVSRRDVLGMFLRRDEEIQADVDTALRLGLGHVADRVTVRVVDGVATVDGSLELRGEAMVAHGLTAAVPGVVGVRDNLTYRADHVADAGVWTGFRP